MTCESFIIWIGLLFSLVMCRRPTALQDRMRDSDDDDLHDRDYDVTALANNLSQAFGYKIYGNEDDDNEEVCKLYLLVVSYPFHACMCPFFACVCAFLNNPLLF